ncbi:MAG: hypothetical protein KDC92_09550, partial [Bacteroidetes bacterium]|nr:hypothetical protein [Bacteroidota bacterium]
MKVVLVICALFCTLGLQAQTTLVLKIETENEGYKLFLDGKEYKTEDAKVLYFKAVNEKFFITFIPAGKMVQPLNHHIATSDDVEHVYAILDTSNTETPLLVEVAKNNVNDQNFKKYDLGDNYAIYRFGISTPELRQGSNQSQSALAKRTKTVKEIPVDSTSADGMSQTKGTEKRTTKTTEVKSVSHTEQEGVIRGGGQYPSMLPPKELKDCPAEWTADQRDSTFSAINEMQGDAKILYNAKLAARDFCFSAADAKQLLSKLGNEAARVDFTKFCYASIT